MPTSRLFALALILATVPLSIARAQPESDPDDRPPPPRMERDRERDENAPPPRPTRDGQGNPARNAPLDSRGFRDALKTIIDHMRETTPRLQKAVDDLDAGRPVDEVRRELIEQRADNSGFVDALRRVGVFGPGFARRNGPETEDGPGQGQGPEAGGPPRSDRPGPGRQLTPEDRTRIAGEIAKHNPDLAAQLTKLREKSPDAADRVVDSLAERMRGMRDLEQRDPDAFKLRQREIKGLFNVLRLRREYADAVRAKSDEAALGELRKQLQVAVAEQWDVKAQLDEKQIADLEKRLERLRQEKLNKSKNRDTAITDTTNSIIRESVKPPRPAPPGGAGGPGGERRGGGPRPPREDAPPR